MSPHRDSEVSRMSSSWDSPRKSFTEACNDDDSPGPGHPQSLGNGANGKDPPSRAVIAIGLRNANLEKRAIAAARRIGKVEVDHGDTSCKTPDAEPYILKASARKKT